MLDLLVIVVNYRTPALTLDCLRSLAPEVGDLIAAGMRARVTVVDNASGDGSFQRLRDAAGANGWDAWLEVLASPRNLGFAGGNNFALRRSPAAEHVLLLNSDTIVHRGCLAHCKSLMGRRPGIGVMSCRLVQPDGAVQTQARRFPAPWRQVMETTGLPWLAPRRLGWMLSEDPGWDRQQRQRDVDWVGGAFMWIRGRVLGEVGPLDEGFFFYGEDIELCHRARRAGWRVHYDPRAAVTHLGGGSAGAGAPVQHKAAYWQARYLVQRKCYGVAASALVRAVDALAWGARVVKLWCLRRRGSRKYRDAMTIWQMLSRPLSRSRG